MATTLLGVTASLALARLAASPGMYHPTQAWTRSVACIWNTYHSFANVCRTEKWLKFDNSYFTTIPDTKADPELLKLSTDKILFMDDVRHHSFAFSQLVRFFKPGRAPLEFEGFTFLCATDSSVILRMLLSNTALCSCRTIQKNFKRIRSYLFWFIRALTQSLRPTSPQGFMQTWKNPLRTSDN
jgi:hypothetical protein